MHCEHVNLGGTTMFVCGGSRRKNHNCDSCGRPGARIQCDYPVRRNGKMGTCDRWQCGQCATQVGPDVHYLPATRQYEAGAVREAMTLGEIEKLTRDYAGAREQLADRVRELEDEVEKTRRSHLPGIKKALERATEKHSELYAAIESAPELFRQPRTLMIANIKIGYQKQKGEIVWQDDSRLAGLVRKHFPDQFDVLVKTVERPLKSALAQLPASDLRRLGVAVIDAGDQVVIRAADSEIDKLVSALLKEARAEESPEAVEA